MQLENEWVSNSVSIVWSVICDVRGRTRGSLYAVGE